MRFIVESECGKRRELEEYAALCSADVERAGRVRLVEVVTPYGEIHALSSRDARRLLIGARHKAGT